jgi:ribonuclease VapC
MFVDASALSAILLNEPKRLDLLDRLSTASRRVTSGTAVFETTAALVRELGQSVETARSIVFEALASLDMEMVTLGQAKTVAALSAFDRFGKGRGHRAQLNMGDCFSYGCATVLGMSMLSTKPLMSRSSTQSSRQHRSRA